MDDFIIRKTSNFANKQETVAVTGGNEQLRLKTQFPI
jgi:hypothetical protein